MSYSFWEGIAETPWWIYWIFFFLFYLAYLTTKPRILFFKWTFISECIFIGLLLFALLYATAFNLHLFFIFMGALLGGTVFGWIQFRFSGIKAIKNKAQFYVPGSWLFFIFMFIVIIAKYYFYGPQFILDPTVLQKPSASTWIVAIGGLMTGLFMGRTCFLIRCLKKGPYIEEGAISRA